MFDLESRDLAPVYQPIVNEKENQTNRDFRDFSRALSKLHGIVFAPAVIGQSYYFSICFTTLNRPFSKYQTFSLIVRQ